MRSRPEISVPVIVNSGAVRPTIHESASSSPTRMNIARNRPIRRAVSRSRGGSRSTRMEMKMMLSMPSTSSSAVNVKKAIQTCGIAENRNGGVHELAAMIVKIQRARAPLQLLKPRRRS
jgi:hypothetical protein